MTTVVIDGVKYAPATAPEAPETDWLNLPPREKVRIVKAMGFGRTHSDHQPDCPYQWDSGNRCNCVPPADSFEMPDDVAKHLGQDWQSRREAAKKPRPIYEAERW